MTIHARLRSTPPARQIARAAAGRAADGASSVLLPLEHRVDAWLGEQGASRYPPVLIIGAPRSGSTLIYKVLVDHYRFTFFNNVTSMFHRLPAIGSWFSRIARLRPTAGDYAIRDGQLRGAGAPHECGRFWYQWFPRGLDVYVGPGEMARADLQSLRLAVGAMGEVGHASPIFKNLYNSMRIAPIVEAIPEASFIVCRRDPLENALSLLQGRVRTQGSKDAWWSLPPRSSWGLREMPYAHQVAGQVILTMQQILADRERFGPERFHLVDYEAFCRDTVGELGEIADFLSSRGVALKKRGPPPHSFEVRPVPGVDPGDRDVVARAVAHLRAEGLP